MDYLLRMNRIEFLAFAPLPAHLAEIYTETRKEAAAMKKNKHLVSYEEWRLIIYALNNLRNSLIAEGKYTDTVDDALLAVMNAKTKKVKIG